MRLLLLTLYNLLRMLLTLLGMPARLLRRRYRPRYVRFRLTGDLPYRRSPRRGLRLFRSRIEPGTVTSLEQLREQLEVLGPDPAVKGVLFEVEELSVSVAKRQAIANLFAQARKAGKEVIAYAVTASTSEYALLCEADRIWLAPAGRLELVGFAAEATALGAGLKQLGVTPHFIRRGDYKTAPELFTHETISEIQRQTLETFLDERYADLVSVVARGRKLSEEQARKRIDEGPYSAKRALAEGLVDALCSRFRLAELLAPEEEEKEGEKTAEKDAEAKPTTTGEPAVKPPEPAAGAKPAEAAAKDGKSKQDEEDEDEEEEKEARRLGSFGAYAATMAIPPNRRWRSAKRPPRLALVPVNGIIGQGSGGLSPFGRVVGSESILRALRAAVRDRRSKAIMLFINSPGGSAIASEIVLEEVQRAAKKKPVVAYFDQVAASGGYMVALGAREIWAAPHAVAGSIGVFAGKFDLSGLLQRLGIHRLVLTRGENAGFQSASREFTPHERAALEADIEETYQVFLEYVAKARSMPKEDVHLRAEGRIFSGTAAHRAGLVDGTSGFEEACRRALVLADVEPERFELTSFAAVSRRLPLPSDLLQLAPEELLPLSRREWLQLANAHVYALWYPWLTLPG